MNYERESYIHIIIVNEETTDMEGKAYRCHYKCQKTQN